MAIKFASRGSRTKSAQNRSVSRPKLSEVGSAIRTSVCVRPSYSTASASQQADLNPPHGGNQKMDLWVKTRVAPTYPSWESESWESEDRRQRSKAPTNGLPSNSAKRRHRSSVPASCCGVRGPQITPRTPWSESA